MFTCWQPPHKSKMFRFLPYALPLLLEDEPVSKAQRGERLWDQMAPSKKHPEELHGDNTHEGVFPHCGASRSRAGLFLLGSGRRARLKGFREAAKDSESTSISWAPTVRAARCP